MKNNGVNHLLDELLRAIERERKFQIEKITFSLHGDLWTDGRKSLIDHFYLFDERECNDESLDTLSCSFFSNCDVKKIYIQERMMYVNISPENIRTRRKLEGGTRSIDRLREITGGHRSCSHVGSSLVVWCSCQSREEQRRVDWILSSTTCSLVGYLLCDDLFFSLLSIWTVRPLILERIFCLFYYLYAIL